MVKFFDSPQGETHGGEGENGRRAFDFCAYARSGARAVVKLADTPVAM